MMKKRLIFLLILLLLGGGVLLLWRREEGTGVLTLRRALQEGHNRLPLGGKKGDHPEGTTSIEEGTTGQRGQGKEDPVSLIISELPKELRDGLRLIDSEDWDETRQTEWQHRLQILRMKADQLVPKIAEALRAIPIERSYPRYQLTFLLGEIGSDLALPALKEVIEEPIPDELMKGPEQEGPPPGGEYLIVKTQAINAMMMIGLEAEGKREEIKGDLFSALGSSYRSVRRAAVMASKQLFPEDRSLKEELTSRLPESERYFYDLKLVQTGLSLSSPGNK
ncbi:MAG: hypothetical protein HY539_04270 [Deltaproteobacteria bacterium]|nr:hypothetical protein [Deltaproteobacteria bacterium]